VSIGFGLVKWTLGSSVKTRIALLAVSYFIATLMLEITEYYKNTVEIPVLEQIDRSSSFKEFMLVIIVSVLDTTFLCWIFVSIIRTVKQLTLRRQIIKTRLYKRFLGILTIGVITSLVVLFFQLLIGYSNWHSDTPSSNSWMTSSFWSILYFLFLVTIGFLFRPRKNNSRYSYAEVYNDDDDEEDDLDATKSTQNRSNVIELENVKSTVNSTSAYGELTQRTLSPNSTRVNYEAERERNIKETASKVKALDDLTSFALSDEDNETEQEVRKME